MKYKRFVYTPIVVIITTIWFTSASDRSNDIRGLLDKYKHASKLERIVAMWNRSSESSHPNPRWEAKEDDFEKWHSLPNFPLEVSKCIEDHQFEITENFSQGKSIILNCFKTSFMLNILQRYLGESSKSSIKLFNGLLEFKKIPEKFCRDENCDNKYNRNFGVNKKDEYVRMYKKAMQKLINERNKFNSYRNLTEEEKANQLNRINENSQAFLTEVIRNIGNEDVEKMEEEKLKKEITDPRLLTMLDALSRSYMLKLRFYPGVSARMMRSNSGGVTFDLEIQESDDGFEEESNSDESITREIKDVSKDESVEIEQRIRPRDSFKKKKKKLKKAGKKLKKILPYLLLPVMIQLALLPFVLKKLFFFAMKALLAGKMALILVAYNLLKNSCVHDDDFHRVRVEHYGYRKGEEYGAWIHGRSAVGEDSLMTALSEEPYGGQKPASE